METGIIPPRQVSGTIVQLSIVNGQLSTVRAFPFRVRWVEVPSLNYLMVDGQGDPKTAEAYGAAVEALFSLAYALKFIVKQPMAAFSF
jgi:hypothetical protein